jgi:small subunit ribosomal protein S17
MAEEIPETESPADAPPEPEGAAHGDAAPANVSEEPPVSEEVTTSPEREAQQPSVPGEVLSPKERKRRVRAAKAGSPRPRTPEERQAERARRRELRRQVRARLGVKRRREPAAREGELLAAARGAAGAREPGRQKRRQGVVVSDRAAKTITVRIDTAHRHRRYEKIVRTSRTVHAHDERGEAHLGDTVIVRECRPLSRTKRWRLERVVERAG